MTKKDIKENVNNMVIQICDYIKASDLSGKEDSEIKLECAMTFLFASINLTAKPIENIRYILEQHVSAVEAIKIETLDSIVSYITGTTQEDKIL